MTEHGRVVGCTDVVGRERVVRVLPVGTGRVGIQPPPGEWFELTLVQVQSAVRVGRAMLPATPGTPRSRWIQHQAGVSDA